MSETRDPLASPDFPGPRVVCFIGRPGFGKTTRALERWWSWPRAIAIDSKHSDPSVPPDYPGLVAWTPAELAKLIRRHEDKARFRICYRGPMFVNGSVEPIFRALGHVHDCLFSVDEAAKFCSASYTPGKPDGGLFAIAHQGRTMGQALTLCAQRSSNIPRDLTGVVEEFWAWCPDEKTDMDFLRGRGFDEEQLRALTGHQALVKTTPPGEPPSFRIVE